MEGVLTLRRQRICKNNENDISATNNEKIPTVDILMRNNIIIFLYFVSLCSRKYQKMYDSELLYVNSYFYLLHNVRLLSIYSHELLFTRYFKCACVKHIMSMFSDFSFFFNLPSVANTN